MHTLVIGHDVSPETFAAINWSALLGPDLYPHTRDTAKAVNNAVKSHRDIVVANQKARRFAGLIAQYTPNLDNAGGDTPFILPDGTPASSAAAAAAAVAAQNAATAKAAAVAAAAAAAASGASAGSTDGASKSGENGGIVGLKVGVAGMNGTDPTKYGAGSTSTSTGGKPPVKKKRGPYKTKARLAAAAAALQAQFPEYASGAVPIDPAVAAAAAAAAMNAKPPSKAAKAKAAAAAAANGGAKLDLPTPPREYFDATTVAAVAAAAAAALEQQQQQTQLQQALAGLSSSSRLPTHQHQHSVGSSAMSSTASVASVEAIDPMLQQQVATPPPAPAPITSAAPHALQHHHIFGSSTSTNALPSASTATSLSPGDISVHSPALQHYSHAGPSSVSPAMTNSLSSAARGRGRPRKHPLPSHMQQSLPADSAAIAAAAAAAVLALPPAQQQHVQPNVTAHQQQIAEAAANQAARVSKKSAAAAARKLQQQQRLQQQQEELRLQLQGQRPRMPPPPLQPQQPQQPLQQQIAPNALYAPQGAEMAATGTIYGHDYNRLLARSDEGVGKTVEAPHIPVTSTSTTPLHDPSKEAPATAVEQAASGSASTPLSPGKGKAPAANRRAGARSANKNGSDEAAEISVLGEPTAVESVATNGSAASQPKGKGKATARGRPASPTKAKKGKAGQDLEVDAVEEDGGATVENGAHADGQSAPAASAHGVSEERADPGADGAQDLEVGSAGDDVHVGEPTTPSRRPSELDEDGEYDETGKKWLSGVKKGFMRLVGY